MKSVERYLGRRFDPRAPRPLVESTFLKANDMATRRALWVRCTIFASARDPGVAVAEAWAIAFDPEAGHVAVRAQAPFAEARFDETGLDVEVLDSRITLSASRGRVASGGREVAWDLSVQGRGEPLVHFPSGAMYEGPIPSSKLVSPLLDARVSGHVAVTHGPEASRASWDVRSWRAMIGHNWGRANAPLYAWGHCNAWDEDEDVVFEGLTARPPLGRGPRGGPILGPRTTLLHLRARGERYDFTSFSSILRNRGDLSYRGARGWRFSGVSRHARIEGEMCGETEDFVGLFYPNPSGPMTYCLNSKIASAWVELRAFDRAPVRFTSKRAALELGTHDPHHGVRMYV